MLNFIQRCGKKLFDYVSVLLQFNLKILITENLRRLNAFLKALAFFLFTERSWKCKRRQKKLSNESWKIQFTLKSQALLHSKLDYIFFPASETHLKELQNEIQPDEKRLKRESFVQQSFAEFPLSWLWIEVFRRALPCTGNIFRPGFECTTKSCSEFTLPIRNSLTQLMLVVRIRTRVIVEHVFEKLSKLFSRLGEHTMIV